MRTAEFIAKINATKPRLSKLHLDCSKLTHQGVRAFISDFKGQLSHLNLGYRSLELNAQEVEKAMEKGGKSYCKIKNKREVKKS